MFFVGPKKIQQTAWGIAQMLHVPIGIVDRIKEATVLARYPLATIRYYLSQLDNSDTNDLASRMRENPSRWLNLYPTLSWAVWSTRTKPNDLGQNDGGARNRSQVIKIVDMKLRPEVVVSRVIEELVEVDPTSAQCPVQAATKLDRFAVAIARKTDDYSDLRLRIQAVYDCVPVHTMNNDLLIMFSWMVGLLNTEAFKNLLYGPVGIGLFSDFPNLALLVWLLRQGYFDRVLLKVAATPGSTIFPARQAPTPLPKPALLIFSAILQEFVQYAGVEAFDLDEETEAMLRIQQIFLHGMI